MTIPSCYKSHKRPALLSAEWSTFWFSSDWLYLDRAFRALSRGHIEEKAHTAKSNYAAHVGVFAQLRRTLKRRYRRKVSSRLLKYCQLMYPD